jgi:hypothetical protein
MSVSDVPHVGFLASAATQTLLSVYEGILGIWLLWGAWPVGAWLLACVTFLTFAGFSAYQGIIGQANCGCLGVLLEVSPWFAFSVDVASLMALAVFPPNLKPDLGVALYATRRIAVLSLTTTAIIGLLALSSVAVFGSVRGGIARLRGERYAVTEYVDFGVLKPDYRAEQNVEVTNWTDAPLHLIGGTTTCACIATTDLPLTIAPHETRNVRISWKTPTTASGSLSQSLKFWTDNPEQPSLSFKAVCNVNQ